MINFKDNKFKGRIHYYYDENNNVFSHGRKLTLVNNGIKYKYNFNNFITRLLYKVSLLKRLFRLDRINVVKTSDSDYLIICNRKVYQIRNTELNFKFKFPFTKYVHPNNICVNKNTIVIGEYGDSKSKYNVGVFISKNKGVSWQKKILFSKGEIKQILSVYFDKYSNNYWVFTGDSKRESKIYLFDQNWNLKTKLGQNNLKYRAISAFFFKKHVIWCMNNPFGKSYVIKYMRDKHEIIKGEYLPGPAWYSTLAHDKIYISIASEVSYYNNDVYLMSSSDAENWKVEKIFKKDIYSKKLFLHGLLTFTKYSAFKNSLLFFCEAVSKFDGYTVKFLYEK